MKRLEPVASLCPIRSLSTMLAAICLLLWASVQSSSAQVVVFEDVNPDRSDTDFSDPDGATGGRVNGLAAVNGNNHVFYAASEWGGIYKSTDGGLNWSRLDGHLPVDGVEFFRTVECDGANRPVRAADFIKNSSVFLRIHA